MQLLFKAGLFHIFVTAKLCQVAFILLRKQEVFIWCYIILGASGFIFILSSYLHCRFLHLDFNVVTLERQKQEVQVKLITLAGFLSF